MTAEAAISSVVELLGNLLVEKVKSIRAVESKVQSLKEELEWMQSFLRKANRKQAEDEGVREWIKKVREVAQDAEDTIEIFLINVENSRNRGLLKRCTGFAKRMYHLDKIGGEIESIRSRLDAIDKSRERYGIKDLDDAPEPAWRSQAESRRRLDHWHKDEHLVGIEDDVKKLLRESILNEEKIGLSVAVLQGMGGIGKSTLARTIYNHSSVVVSGRFDYRGWVVLSSEFTPQETIKQIIFQLQSSEKSKQKVLEEIKKMGELMKDELYIQGKLKEMLHEQLEGKSYFIVLDDVWENEHLESLINAFPNQQDKSRLLVTTRNKINVKNDQYVHKMKLLDPEKSWGLFLKKLFIGKCPEELESIGRQIVEKCCGLPLAISVVAGLLVGADNKISSWKEVLNQINSYLGSAESSVSIILELSYQNLSPQLKSCFLCLAFFKEDYTIPAKRLINTWVGQGLIQKEGNITIDEIARGYLNELINRSMLQIENLHIDDRVQDCRLHDILREVCLRKANEEIGLEIVKGEGQSSLKSSGKPRHRVIYGLNLESSSLGRNTYLRSLFLLNVNGIDGNNALMTSPSHYWKSFHLLKMLDLEGCRFPKLPRSFRSFIGLKSLRIQKFQDGFYVILELPFWLGELKNLEVLCVEDQKVEFPNTALKMERLRHFDVDFVIGKQMKIEKWKNIETLKYIKLQDWIACGSELIMRTCHLRELGIYINLDIENEDSADRTRAKALLEKMTNLVELHLLFDGGFPIEELIPKLESLTKLELRTWWIGMMKPPPANAFPPNLSHLTLAMDVRPFFWSYERFLWGDRTIKVSRDGFQCLKVLSLQGFTELEGIDIEEGGMPQLQHLRILSCNRFHTSNLPKHMNISTA